MGGSDKIADMVADFSNNLQKALESCEVQESKPASIIEPVGAVPELADVLLLDAEIYLPLPEEMVPPVVGNLPMLHPKFPLEVDTVCAVDEDEDLFDVRRFSLINILESSSEAIPLSDITGYYPDSNIVTTLALLPPALLSVDDETDDDDSQNDGLLVNILESSSEAIPLPDMSLDMLVADSGDKSYQPYETSIEDTPKEIYTKDVEYLQIIQTNPMATPVAIKIDVVSESTVGKASTFYNSKVWFLLFTLSILLNMFLAGVILWQKLRIDYIMDKILN